MTKHCPTCGAAVRVVSADEGTSHYEPLPVEGTGLREALAEGLHKAMCFGPAVLHNRIACERPAVYLNLADAALGHPAMREVLGVAQRSSDAAFGAIAALGGDLDTALAALAATTQPETLDRWKAQIERLTKFEMADWPGQDFLLYEDVAALRQTLDVERLARAIQFVETPVGGYFAPFQPFIDRAEAYLAALPTQARSPYIEYRTTACHAGSDGDCSWEDCPQLRDGEPVATGRHCPLDAEPRAPWSPAALPTPDADR